MSSEKQPKVHIIHENQAWIDPLIGFLEASGTPYENWFINEGQLDLSSIPPEGVFYNRMSASSHTRDHRYAIELTESVLGWLELHNRRVINNRQALSLEVRKSDQLLALRKAGLKAPVSVVVNTSSALLQAAKNLGSFPFIVKPNRGGKGLGVKLYNTLEQLDADIQNQQLPETLDGIWLVQEYIKPEDGTITRVELIGGKFYYAVRVDASGGFELCPSDVCQVEDAFCPVDAKESSEDAIPKFQVLENYQNEDISRYEDFFRTIGVEIGAMEYVVGADGQRYIYDINTNTNYNATAEARLDNRWQGMRAIAEFLNYELITSYYKNRIRVA